MLNLLGIDLGTSSVKVLITDQDGLILSRGSADYPMLTPQPSWVEQSAIGAEGLFFTPNLSGERAAAEDSQVRGAFLGLTICHGRAEFVRAVLEGVVYTINEK